ncbi:MAG: multifunctional oxoglutarate decarboxylase/oxoglutarate dehydrogenase thiamine pyrophosphate-binding subunit/dihydrolipoyllysine-residue succinyltransferase subunit, partial [Balneolaceae bacterium]|nr:multifunctional oxoglutarate decarboxylase/oxoglutarate dehydrogenase thiamine pyrophosphate-binding subunit/dihydrolipoyllysine-residue succinyltransferase subunit [Balneolaceae bacterium]
RKQAKMEDKRPLIIMSPKSLLRHPMATSKAEELAEGSYHPTLRDQDLSDREQAEKLILCSGKVYYDLLKHRLDNEIDNIALVRLEQFYPFPDKDIREILNDYNHVKDIVWCQEEPRNMGAWFFVSNRISNELQDGQQLSYVGRQASASPATGQKKIHEAEQKRLIEEAMTV